MGADSQEPQCAVAAQRAIAQLKLVAALSLVHGLIVHRISAEKLRPRLLLAAASQLPFQVWAHRGHRDHQLSSAVPFVHEYRI